MRAQVENIGKSEKMREAWAATNASADRRKVYVHGWVYELESGRLRDLGVSRGPEGLVGDKFVGGLGLGQ